MATVLFLGAVAVCFFLDAVGVAVKRVALTALGLLFVTIPLIVSAWPAELTPS